MNDERKSCYGVVNLDTGEILDYFEPGDRIKKKKNLDKKMEYLDTYVVDFNKGEKFVKLYDESVKMMRTKLTKAEFMFAIALENFVSYDDCILRTGGHGNGKYLSMSDIAELLDETYHNTYRIMTNLIKKGVIGKHTTGSIYNNNELTTCFTVNPYIYQRGTKVNKTIASFYENSGWK